jgi:hypothetical protein
VVDIVLGMRLPCGGIGLSGMRRVCGSRRRGSPRGGVSVRAGGGWVQAYCYGWKDRRNAILRAFSSA